MPDIEAMALIRSLSWVYLQPLTRGVRTRALLNVFSSWAGEVTLNRLKTGDPSVLRMAWSPTRLEVSLRQRLAKRRHRRVLPNMATKNSSSGSLPLTRIVWQNP